jgi:hypothetical protein
MPVIRSVRAVPDTVDPLGCPPPNPPERPEVTVVVDDPDTPPHTLVLELSWEANGAGASYRGETRMTYEPRRKAFVHRLPPVTGKTVGERARSISLNVSVRNGWRAGDFATHETVRPGYIGIAGRCVHVTN